MREDVVHDASPGPSLKLQADGVRFDLEGLNDGDTADRGQHCPRGSNERFGLQVDSTDGNAMGWKNSYLDHGVRLRMIILHNHLRVECVWSSIEYLQVRDPHFVEDRTIAPA